MPLSQRQLYNGQKQAKRANRLGKLLVFYWFRQVDVTSKRVAARDFVRLIGGSQDDDGNVPGARIGLETFEHLIAVEPGQVQIE